MKQLLIAALVIFLMSGVASADVEIGLPYGYRNFAPDETYTFIDFNDGKYNMIPFNGLLDTESIKFVDYLGTYNFIGHDEPAQKLNVWGWADAAHNLMHVYPGGFYYNPDGSPVDFIYLIEGESAGCPTMLWGWDWYPGIDGVILFSNGADHISFIVSTGGNFQGTTYDAKGNIIERLSTGSNTERVYLPDGPSTWTRFSFDSEKSDIYKVHLRGISNGWHIDDLVIGGLTISEPPADYSYAAERLKQLIGLGYLQYGTAWDYVIGGYRTAEEMMDDKPDPYIDFNTKSNEVEFGIGINDQDAILWAFNGEGEDHINWWDINKMIKQDFTEVVEDGDQKPGDVFFIDYPQEFADGGYGPDGCYDEIGMVIEPTVDSAGDVVNIIRITPEDGVYYSTTDLINAQFGNSGFVDYRSLPANPKGGHSPYKKIPAGKLI